MTDEFYETENEMEHEFCPRCEANLTLQKGYSNELYYWICRGCGQMLINPEVPGDTAWICDECGAMLNVQEGFSEEAGSFCCTECGHVNRIDTAQLYLSEDEFIEDSLSPYYGLSDEAALALSMYSEEGSIGGRSDILLARNMEDGRLYVKKILATYDASVYEYLVHHPVQGMPRICEIFEADNYLIVIEEYIEGDSLADVIAKGPLEPSLAHFIASELCKIMMRLHSLPKPIIHRDIKAGNVIVSGDGEVYLLDMNVAKWYKEGETEDTRFLGTKSYAAPEQAGFGFFASSEKSDVYALGMLLNVMLTGEFPKKKRACGALWEVIKGCICLEMEERFSDEELLLALKNCAGNGKYAEKTNERTRRDARQHEAG